MVYHKISMTGGSVKELKVIEEEKIIKQDKNKNNNISVIPQKTKHINENKISQDKLNRFVNLKLKF